MWVVIYLLQLLLSDRRAVCFHDELKLNHFVPRYLKHSLKFWWNEESGLIKDAPMEPNFFWKFFRILFPSFLTKFRGLLIVFALIRTVS